MTRWELGLVVVTGILALAAGYIGLLTSERQQSLIDATHYNSVFDASQTAAELVRLEAQIGRYALAPAPDLRDDVQLRFGIIQSRLGTLSSGDLSAIIGSDPDAARNRQTLVRSLDAASPLIAAIDAPGNPKAALATLAQADTPTFRIMSFVNAVSSVEVENGRERLRSVFHQEGWLCLSLVVCGLILAVMLMRRNRKVYELAHLDQLTGLPNRRVFNSTLADLASHAGAADELAVMLLDVDHFKAVNDVLGHASGDALLQGWADRLNVLLRGAVLVARLGGDEFAVLWSSPGGARDALAEVAQRLCEYAAEPFSLHGKTVSSSMSVGIAIASGACDPQTLLTSADVALYAAKAAGRGTFRFFDPGMEAAIRARRQMEADLRVAIRNGEMDVHFQPIIDLETQSIVGCEALARWSHPVRGLISPTEFIPVAEEIGIVSQLGEWVLHRACAAAQTWPRHIRVAVNLSPHQFQGTGLAERIERILSETGLRPQRLEVEITESVLLRDTDQVMQTLWAVKHLGARIALDDFGSGYSSLAYLQWFPIDKIKIDQSFVREITRNPQSAMIVESMGALANRLGLTTTAEGIESEAHAMMVRSMGYAEGQGHFFDKPLTAEACLARLRAQKDSRVAA